MASKPDTKVSASAGAGKNMKKTTQGSISKPSTTKGSTKASSKPAPAMSTFTFKPQSNYPKSGPMQTHLINRRAATPDPPKQSGITRAALRKRLPSDTASSPSAVSASSDSEEVITPAAARIAAFHEARGLTFEELHVHPTEDATVTDLPAHKSVPQKNSNSAMKSPAKTSTGNAKPAKSASHKRTIATIDGAVVKPSSARFGPATKTEAPIKKRAADSDSEDSSSPVKRLKINGPRLPVEPDLESNDDEPASVPAKRLKITKITVNPPPVILDVPASSADKSAAKSKGAQVITKNGKVKKTPEYAVEHAFEGTPSNHGTSLECPQFGTLDVPWPCANLACTTGMTWVPRDTKDSKTGKGPMGRKVISQFFGRNKGPTKLIPNDVWHYYCRKDYQRARYAAEHGTADELAKQVIDNLRDQIIRLKLWRPDALFQVQLDKGATDRLNNYFALLRQHNNDEAAALAALPAPKDPKKVKPEEAFPPALAEEFNQRFKTAGKTAAANYDDIESIIAWSEAQINAGNSTVFVPAEFLINPIQTDETVNDVATNFAEWEAERAIRTAQANASSTSAAPNTSTTMAQPQDVIQSIEDPDATESEHETSTPTPAPRRSRISTTTSNDPMALMRDLNEQAVRQGYHARSDRSSS